jgi:hypothetical protein
MISSVVAITVLVKILSSTQTQRTFGGDMDMIRSDLLKYLAHCVFPGKGNLDFVVARAINIAEPPGIKIYNTIVVPNRTRLNIFVGRNHTIDLLR